MRHASRLLVAGAALRVPLVAVILRRGYGLGAQAMVGGSLHEPLLTVAWPSAAPRPDGPRGRGPARPAQGARGDRRRGRARAARARAHRRRARRTRKALNAATLFELDDVIDPAETRGADRRRRSPRRAPAAPTPARPLRRHLVGNGSARRGVVGGMTPKNILRTVRAAHRRSSQKWIRTWRRRFTRCRSPSSTTPGSSTSCVSSGSRCTTNTARWFASAACSRTTTCPGPSAAPPTPGWLAAAAP